MVEYTLDKACKTFFLNISPSKYIRMQIDNIIIVYYCTTTSLPPLYITKGCFIRVVFVACLCSFLVFGTIIMGHPPYLPPSSLGRVRTFIQWRDTKGIFQTLVRPDLIMTFGNGGEVYALLRFWHRFSLIPPPRLKVRLFFSL